MVVIEGEPQVTSRDWEKGDDMCAGKPDLTINQCIAAACELVPPLHRDLIITITAHQLTHELPHHTHNKCCYFAFPAAFGPLNSQGGTGDHLIIMLSSFPLFSLSPAHSFTLFSSHPPPFYPVRLFGYWMSQQSSSEVRLLYYKRSCSLTHTDMFHLKTTVISGKLSVNWEETAMGNI